MSIIMNNLPAFLIAIPMLGAILTPIISRYGDALRNGWILLISLLTSITSLLVASKVMSAGTIVYTFGVSSLNQIIPPDSGGVPFRIIFTIDAMNAFMLIIAAIVGFCIMLYSVSSMSKLSGKDGFYTLLFLLVTGVNGMIATGDIFNFFVFLEISSLAGAALVAYRIDRGVAAEAGLKYGALSTIGGLLFLVGIGILLAQYNSLNMAVLASRIQMTPLDMIAFVLFFAALAMKCGAVPMHFWTPDSYSMAPSAVTAFLVVSSQASLYGLFRVCYTLYGSVINTATIGWIIIILGVLSMFIGVTMAIPQKDVKRLMAYHAVSQTGYMLLGVGVGLAALSTPCMLQSIGIPALKGGLFHIMNHAIYKGLLFMTAGVIFYRCGTRNLNKLGGLGHNMKWTMIFFIIGALAIAGIPPFNGFASKLLIYESVFLFNPILAVIAMVVSILTLASFVKVFHSMFMGPQLPEFADVKEAPLPMLIGMGILAALVILFGIFPQQVVDILVAPAATALIDHSGYIHAVLGGA
ncbi:MAG TPA: proton-conducting transporter membrane subunit [Methanospirillum sp.]|nr:proton-conducting transporter membrane subunit [Methanospirillum sp.]